MQMYYISMYIYIYIYIPINIFIIASFYTLSELEVNAGAHVYPNGLEGVQLDSNPVIAHWCYSAQGSPLLRAVCVARISIKWTCKCITYPCIYIYIYIYPLIYLL
jgi:hypothetical protein